MMNVWTPFTDDTNHVNVLLLHIFGDEFALRYRDLHNKMETLVGSHHPSPYVDALIKPGRKTLEALIVKEYLHI